MKKTSHYARKRRRLDPLAGLRALDHCRPNTPADTVDRHLRCRAALERLKSGEASTDDFDLVAMSLNVAKVRAMKIDTELADAIEDAQTALTEVRERFYRVNKWGFTALQLAAVVHAIDAYEAIHDASTPMQMHQAMDAVCRAINKQIGARP